MTDTPPPDTKTALHAIALFEAVKGVAAIAASISIVSLMHDDEVKWPTP